jgi:serine/threonine protein kinase
MDGEIGGYRLGSTLGEGGAGVVFRATQPGLDRAVALKVLREVFRHTEDELRFQREVRVATRLVHPALVRLLDGGVDGDRQFLVMELVEGRDLYSALPRGVALPWRLAVAIAARVADGLAAMHAAGIVHRDVKAGNILLSRAGAVKLGDFGLARPVDATAVTRAGDIVGTIEVMSPEVLSGEPATPPSDLWSLGCLLYRMLTGHSHIPIEPASTWPSRVVSAPIDPPGRHVPDLPAELALLAMSLLDRTPARRPTASTSHHSLTALLDSPDDLLAEHIPALVEGRAPAPPPRAAPLPAPEKTERLQPFSPPPKPRHAFLALTVSVSVLCLFLLATHSTRHSPPAASTPAPSTSTSTSTPTPTSLFLQWRRIAHLTARLEADTKNIHNVADSARARVDLDLGSTPDAWLHWIRLGRYLSSSSASTAPPRYAETHTVVTLDLDVERALRAGQRILFDPKARAVPPESLALLLQAAGLGPDHPGPWLALAHVLALDGNPRESDRCLDLALARLPKSPLNANTQQIEWVGLLRALLRADRRECARLYWRHARVFAAFKAQVWNAVERANTLEDGLDEELLTAAVEHRESAPQGLEWLLDRLRRHDRDPALAQAAIRRALATAPDDPRVRATVEKYARD